MASLFGFVIKRKEKDNDKVLDSFVQPSNDDGAVVVSAGGTYGTYVDLDGSIRTEAELVTKYRTMAMDPIIDLAITEITNETIVEDEDDESVTIDLDKLDTSESIKNKIREEFDNVKGLLEFDFLSYEIFRRWYVDGRLYYHAIIDDNNPKAGIKQLRYIDPRQIKKIREIERTRTNNGVEIEKLVDEYYIYNKSSFVKKAGSYSNYGSAVDVGASGSGVKISKDSVVYTTSGYLNPDNNLILSYLNKAIRPLNNLRSMENSLVIYRISRAPERRLFYVDVGGLPKAKAEQYLRDLMIRFKNKTVYDSETGEIRDDRKFMTMLEDYWLPRREGSRGTEVSTLPGGQNLGEMDDVLYFQKLLYESLNVPVSRLQSDAAFSFGRATEISRDEVKFAKFIIRIRKKFSELFTKLLERQLLLKGICTSAEWCDWRKKIKYDYPVDNYFHELKNMEILRDRLSILRDIDEYVGKYYSHGFVRRNILHQTDEEIKINDEAIVKEKTDDRYSEHDMEEFGLKTDSSDTESPHRSTDNEKLAKLSPKEKINKNIE